jgi:hypothetical protein
MFVYQYNVISLFGRIFVCGFDVTTLCAIEHTTITFFCSRFVMHNYQNEIKESGTKAGSCIGEVEYRRANGN